MREVSLNRVYVCVCVCAMKNAIVNVALTDSCTLFLDRIMPGYGIGEEAIWLFPYIIFSLLLLLLVFIHFEYNIEKISFWEKVKGKIRCEIDCYYNIECNIIDASTRDWFSSKRKSMNFIGSFKTDRLPVVGSASMANVWRNWKSCKENGKQRRELRHWAT